jgi:hypothetical protein
MKLAALLAALLTALLGVASSVLLTKGSEHVPWSMQSYGGSTDTEKGFKAKRQRWTLWGLWLLAAAFATSAVSAVLGYLS